MTSGRQISTAPPEPICRKAGPMFLLRLSFWLLLLKLFALLFVGIMAVMQIPELRYDFGLETPLAIDGPEELQRLAPRKATFVAITGSPDFERAFVYNGLMWAVWAHYFPDTRLMK